MIVNINTKILLKELRFLSKAASKNVPAPILNCVHFSATGKDLYLTTSNLDITTRSKIEPNNVKEEGQVVVSSKKLLQLVSLIEAEDIQLTTKETTLNIKAGKSTYKIQGEPVANFPTISVEKSPLMQIDGSTLYAMINKCMISLKADEERYNFNGVHFKSSVGLLKLVSTDGMRLSGVDTKVPGAKDFGILVPKSSLDDIKNILLTNEEPTTFGFDENHLWFAGDSRELISRLSTGNFPETDRLFFDSAAIKKDIELERAELLGCLQRLGVTGDEVTPLVNFIFKNDTLTLSSSDDTSEGSEFISIKEVYDADIIFNLRQLVDFLNVSTAKTVKIQTDSAQNRFQWFSPDLNHKYILSKVVVH